MPAPVEAGGWAASGAGTASRTSVLVDLMADRVPGADVAFAQAMGVDVERSRHLSTSPPGSCTGGLEKLPAGGRGTVHLKSTREVLVRSDQASVSFFRGARCEVLRLRGDPEGEKNMGREGRRKEGTLLVCAMFSYLVEASSCCCMAEDRTEW